MKLKAFKYLVFFLGAILLFDGYMLSKENTFLAEQLEQCPDQGPCEEDRSEVSELEMDEFMQKVTELFGQAMVASGLHIHFKDDLSDHIFEPQSPPPERA